MKTLAGIVLYNPDVTRLLDNINAISQQVDTVLLVENGSSNTNYISHLNGFTNLIFIDNHASMGIAFALNEICGYAYTHGYDWALTLDQDSVATPGMIDTYKQIIREDIGLIGCWVEDRGYDNGESAYAKMGTFKTNSWMITSGTFTNVMAWKKCGGFDSTMFIGFVDWDICEAMRRAGFEIWITFKAKLIQEIGHNTRIVKIFNTKVMVSNHAPSRTRYEMRNMIYMAKKYKHISYYTALKTCLYKLFVVERYEKQKPQKLFAWLRGVCEGLFTSPKYEHISSEFLSLEATPLSYKQNND